MGLPASRVCRCLLGPDRRSAPPALFPIISDKISKRIYRHCPQKLKSEMYPGLEAVWSDRLGAEIANRASAILTNIEAALAESYRQVPPPTFE